MHKKYAKDGLVAISVSLDDPKDDKVRKKINDFLSKQEADFRDFILTDKAEVWQAKLKFDGPPAVFVFDKSGKYQKYTEPDYAQIEKYVTELLKK